MERSIKAGDRVLVRDNTDAFVDAGAVITERLPRARTAKVDYVSVLTGELVHGVFHTDDLRKA